MIFEPIPATDPEFVRLLESADLPVDDLGGEHQAFWAGRNGTGELVIVAGLERCGNDGLLRSVAVRGDMRGQGLGGVIVAFVLERAFSNGVGVIFLLTATDAATAFFSAHGFTPVDRSSVPEQVAASAQFSEICPDSATAMSLSREDFALTGR